MGLWGGADDETYKQPFFEVFAPGPGQRKKMRGSGINGPMRRGAGSEAYKPFEVFVQVLDKEEVLAVSGINGPMRRELMMTYKQPFEVFCSRSWTKGKVRAVSGINGPMRRELMIKPITNLLKCLLHVLDKGRRARS
ncbi:hypothetical protein AVEN_217773-1 [Araneus ventricosus]|uniref:Uncharacterized protein n=1 Tax=Araneus ventricosus TaxID=182803 RepID=A0A4Y2TSK5_ARAVE|nr:hypothetical protein AVEN_217773-1 [Araneus ventricosus]